MNTRVPVGAVLIAKSWAVPGTYLDGRTFDDFEDAVAAALSAWAADTSDLTIGPPVVDERWTMRYPDGAVSEFVVARTTIDPQHTESVVGQAARRTAQAAILINRGLAPADPAPAETRSSVPGLEMYQAMVAMVRDSGWTGVTVPTILRWLRDTYPAARPSAQILYVWIRRATTERDPGTGDTDLVRPIPRGRIYATRFAPTHLEPPRSFPPSHD